MQIHHIGYGIRGFYKLAKLGQFWDMIPKEAQYRLKVLRFWKKYGLEATREAFGVSRRTLYRWQAKLRAARGDPTALQPKKPIPRRKRQSHWPEEVIDHIRYLREKYPNLGKARIYVLLKPWCEERGLTDLEGFNRRLAEWLIGYNTVLPHHSLGLKPPVRWLLENHPECQRLWTNTES